MKHKKKKKKGINYSAMRCPYCGSTVIYRSADGIYNENHNDVMLYVCSKYPECDSYVRVHEGTTRPVGTMANGELRALRDKAHKQFDKIHKTGIMTKDDAYRWLANILQAPLSEAHIGHLSEHYCNLVIDESKKVLERHRPSRVNLTRESLCG